jgi:excisionase family DNA binding protein
VKKNLSTFEIAQMLQVDPGSVSNWIDQGRLRGYRTPGGHRRVNSADLVEFLRDKNMPVPEKLESGPVRVLVVADEGRVSGVADRIRRQNPDYEVLEASDVSSAGRLAVSERPDLVIMDLEASTDVGELLNKLSRSRP